MLFEDVYGQNEFLPMSHVGALPIKRLAYNIGEGEWKDTSMVADDVTIKFHVVAGQ